MSNIDERILKLAAQIRDEKKLGANTATRVGGFLVQLLEYLEGIYLRKDVDDTAAGLIMFGEFIDSMLAGKGAGIYPNGRAQFESVEVRGSLKVLELIFNRLSAVESDFVFTEAGTIDAIEQIDETTYRATIKKRHDNDFTGFKEGDVLRGVVNTLLTTGDYYTSWTRVLSVNTVANTVYLSVYADSEVPAGENHPPMPLMVLHRWGNTYDTTRQSTWYLSSTEGRIVWLDGVTKPILEESNYASFYGKPVHLSIFDNKAINYDQPYLYVRGLAVQDLIRIDYAGKVIKDIRDRGIWEASPEEPYRNMDTLQDDVWLWGARWRCLIDQTTQEPKWNATDWQMIEGNSNLNMVLTSSEGTAFLVGDFATTVTPTVYYGNVDISSDVLSTDWAWTRDTGNVTLDNAWALAHANNGRVLTLTNEDLGVYASTVGTVMFTCTAYVRDGDIVTEISASLNIE